MTGVIVPISINRTGVTLSHGVFQQVFQYHMNCYLIGQVLQYSMGDNLLMVQSCTCFHSYNRCYSMA